MVATPPTISSTPKKMVTAKVVPTVSDGTTIAAVPATTSTIPSRRTHSQCERRCCNSCFRISRRFGWPAGPVSVPMLMSDAPSFGRGAQFVAR